MASCWKSFSPKKARQLPASEMSLVTTVATPAKCPGRDAPSRHSANRPGSTLVEGTPSGYISPAMEQRQARRRPLRPSPGPRSRSRRVARRDPRRQPNCSGFTKMVAATTSHAKPLLGTATGALRAGLPSSGRARAGHLMSVPTPRCLAKFVVGWRLPPRTGPGRTDGLGRLGRCCGPRQALGQGRHRRRSRRALTGPSPGGAVRSC